MSSKEWSVLYHSDCADGFCSAWIASTFLGRDNNFHPIGYGDELPKYLAPNVLIVDFSLPRDKLEALAETSESLLVLDHHKSAAEQLKGLDYCEFDMNRSGAMITWDHFNAFHMDSNPTPWIVKYVQDRDLWQWKLPKSKEINTFLSALPNDFERWDRARAAGPEIAFEMGEAMLMYKDALVKRLVKNTIEVIIDGWRVRCVNTPCLQSEVGHELAKDRPFGVVYSEMSNGNWRYSLRADESVSSPDFDVSELARKLGTISGGGHKKAAGFIVEELVHRS